MDWLNWTASKGRRMTEYFWAISDCLRNPKNGARYRRMEHLLVDKRRVYATAGKLVSIYHQARFNTDRIDIADVQATTFGSGGAAWFQ
jgi:hypothetical protein